MTDAKAFNARVGSKLKNRATVLAVLANNSGRNASSPTEAAPSPT
jgi:hypothetical protein